MGVFTGRVGSEERVGQEQLPGIAPLRFRCVLQSRYESMQPVLSQDPWHAVHLDKEENLDGPDQDPTLLPKIGRSHVQMD